MSKLIFPRSCLSWNENIRFEFFSFCLRRSTEFRGCQKMPFRSVCMTKWSYTNKHTTHHTHSHSHKHYGQINLVFFSRLLLLLLYSQCIHFAISFFVPRPVPIYSNFQFFFVVSLIFSICRSTQYREATYIMAADGENFTQSDFRKSVDQLALSRCPCSWCICGVLIV